jgi:hypothetical protein
MMTTRDELPRHTTPTWEMELLISGATVFALLQLPGVLDDLFYTYFPRFARPLAEMIMLPYLYGKSTVYALIGTFILHLAARGYWVGLVGLRSVYPDGVRWDRLKFGPHYRAALQARTPQADALVERADNRASLVFGYGVGFALLTLVPLFLVAVVALATWLFQLATGGLFPWQRVWMILLVLSVAPLMLLVGFDRWFGKRLAPGGAASRLLATVMRGYLRTGMGSASSYPMLMFISRAGQKRGSLVLTLALFALIAITFAQMMMREGEIDVGSYGALALGEPGAERALRSENYADRRLGSERASTAPFIPHEVVRGDWLRLFVPFQPRRDPAALQAECGEPMLSAAAGDAAQAASRRAWVLDCLARVYAPQLDGKPVADLRFDVAEDERSGFRGVVAMIAVATLAPGRHELLVRRVRSPAAEPGDPVPAPHRIVFWR